MLEKVSFLLSIVALIISLAIFGWQTHWQRERFAISVSAQLSSPPVLKARIYLNDLIENPPRNESEYIASLEASAAMHSALMHMTICMEAGQCNMSVVKRHFCKPAEAFLEIMDASAQSAKVYDASRLRFRELRSALEQCNQ